MKTISLLAMCTLCLCLTFATSVNANQIMNGSFEFGSYNNNGGGYSRLTPGSTAITNWVVGGNGLDWHIIDGGTAHFGRNGLNGSQYAVDLSLDYSPAGSISQTFATTPGTQYQLSFLLGAPQFDSAVNVSVAGLSQTFSLAGQSQYDFPWQKETLNFIASGSFSTLLFESVQGGYWGPVLDNVSVEAATNPVPEPSTMLLLGAGLISLVFWRRKKA